MTKRDPENHDFCNRDYYNRDYYEHNHTLCCDSRYTPTYGERQYERVVTCGLYCSVRQNSTIRRERKDRIVVYDGFDYE